jgi:hypothetical protein
MDTNRGWRHAAACLLFAVLFPASYIGSYALLADNSGRLEMRDDGCCYTRQYHYGAELTEAVYWPAHFVDVKLRPTHWGVHE